MAHIIQVPVSVEFAPASRKWEVCVAQLCDLPEEKLTGEILPPITAPVLSPTPRKGVRLRRAGVPVMLAALYPSLYTAMDFMGQDNLSDFLQSANPTEEEPMLEILVSFPCILSQIAFPIRGR